MIKQILGRLASALLALALTYGLVSLHNFLSAFISGGVFSALVFLLLFFVFYLVAKVKILG